MLKNQVEISSKDRWLASAPPNIALIKYMGKKPQLRNVPTNSSLSYTLDHLRTYVELEVGDFSKDDWVLLESSLLMNFAVEDQLFGLELSEKGKIRYLEFFSFLKKKMNIDNYNFIVRSNNNFPGDCGIASSASSFAALTVATYSAAKTLNPEIDLSLDDLAHLSRQGSGSSCRSFYSPWTQWEESEIYQIDFPYKSLLHQVYVVESEKKNVSSSEAHKRITSSLLNQGREARAEERLKNLCRSLKQLSWKEAFCIVWAEFWDMHALFETSHPPFGYMSKGSLRVLTCLRKHWEEFDDGPIVTMDAGPNIHCLYRDDQRKMAEKIQKELKDFSVYKNYE
ncbi:MAG: diphosphomevalonate decarboxylase [Bdellovibrionales bacterium]|nr:diphosphomevalonate decarboxylase [Bdellovibrionales bacterium]